jgi:hypothetical protein
MPTLWLSADGRSWSATPLPVPPATSGSAIVIRETGGRVVVFGYVMQDMGNGGDWPVAHLVWTLEPPNGSGPTARVRPASLRMGTLFGPARVVGTDG